jgi:hypothetical protein
MQIQQHLIYVSSARAQAPARLITPLVEHPSGHIDTYAKVQEKPIERIYFPTAPDLSQTVEKALAEKSLSYHDVCAKICSGNVNTVRGIVRNMKIYLENLRTGKNIDIRGRRRLEEFLDQLQIPYYTTTPNLPATSSGRHLPKVEFVLDKSHDMAIDNQFTSLGLFIQNTRESLSCSRREVSRPSAFGDTEKTWNLNLDTITYIEAGDYHKDRIEGLEKILSYFKIHFDPFQIHSPLTCDGENVWEKAKAILKQRNANLLISSARLADAIGVERKNMFYMINHELGTLKHEGFRALLLLHKIHVEPVTKEEAWTQELHRICETRNLSDVALCFRYNLSLDDLWRIKIGQREGFEDVVKRITEDYFPIRDETIYAVLDKLVPITVDFRIRGPELAKILWKRLQDNDIPTIWFEEKYNLDLSNLLRSLSTKSYIPASAPLISLSRILKVKIPSDRGDSNIALSTTQKNDTERQS